jgi:hypothetical protein
LTLHRVGIEADPAPVCRPGRRPEGSEPGLATRTRGTGVGPRAARELNPRPRTRLQPSPSGGSLRAIACQRPDEAVKGTGPGSVRWRLITQRSHVRLRTRVKPRGKQGFRMPSESEDHGRPLSSYFVRAKGLAGISSLIKEFGQDCTRYSKPARLSTIVAATSFISR